MFKRTNKTNAEENENMKAVKISQENTCLHLVGEGTDKEIIISANDTFNAWKIDWDFFQRKDKGWTQKVENIASGLTKKIVDEFSLTCFYPTNQNLGFFAMSLIAILSSYYIFI